MKLRTVNRRRKIASAAALMAFLIAAGTVAQPAAFAQAAEETAAPVETQTETAAEPAPAPAEEPAGEPEQKPAEDAPAAEEPSVEAPAEKTGEEETETLPVTIKTTVKPGTVYAALYGTLMGVVPSRVRQAAAQKVAAAEGVEGAPPVKKGPASPEDVRGEYTPEQAARIANFYGNTVFVGDSVLLGFRNYCQRGDEVLQRLNFLVAGSYSLHNAFWEVSKKSVHPRYMGKQYQVWESMQMIAPDRAFLFFGINDMVYGVEDSVQKYQELIAKLNETNPNTEINIISTTYTKAGAGKKLLNNDNIAEFNRQMSALAAANGWGFVDMATPTSDGAGNLLDAYCTDGFVHQTNAAYIMWEKVIKDYALARTGGA